MKQFIAFVVKEFCHILRDRRTMLILFGMPVVQIILFGFALSTEVRNIQTAVLVQDYNMAFVRPVIERLKANEYFSLKYIVHTPEEMEQLFRQNKIELAVVFPVNTSNKSNAGMPQVIADASDPNLAKTRSAYAVSVLSEAVRTLQVASAPAGMPLNVSVKLLYNPRLLSAYNFVPGVMGLLLMLICAMMTSISIVREKETGTMELLLVSPIAPFLIIISKAIPYLAMSLLNFSVILLLSVFVLGVPIAGSLLTLSLLSLLFIFVCLSLGLLISCVTQTQVAAMLVSGMVLLLPTILLSGIIFPIESMPEILQAVSCLSPARWYVDIVRKVMIEGVPFVYVWKQTVVLCCMAVVLVVVTTRLFKDRLE